MLGKAPRDVLLDILHSHKLLAFPTDAHADGSMPTCSCGHALADDTIEEHQTDLIVKTFLNLLKD